MDRSVGVTCADGAAVRVTRSRAWLERLGTAGIAPIRRLAGALSARLAWPQTTPGWPFKVEVTSLFNLQAGALPGAEGCQPGAPEVLEQPAPEDDDPEEKGRGIAAPRDEATFLPEEDPEGPEEDGFGLG